MHQDTRIGEKVGAMHASAPEGCGCSDCAMSQEACPECYAVWWRKRHPNHTQVGGEFDTDTAGVPGTGGNDGR